MYAVSAAEFTAEGTADTLVIKYIPLWGCPASFLSDNGPQSFSKLLLAVHKLLGMRKIVTSAYHPNGNGGVERINHAMAQMPAMVVSERQYNWDVHLPHVEFACNNSVSAATGLAPNEVHMNRFPRLPVTIFKHRYARGHQSLARDHLEYCDLAADHQPRTYALVHKPRALTISRTERRHSALSDALKQLLIYNVGGWVWTYNTVATIHQGAKSGTDAKVIKEKLSLDWMGLFQILAVGPLPADSTPDGRPMAAKFLYLDLLTDMPGPDAHCRVSVARCKPCTNPHDTADLPRYLPAGLTQNVLNNYTTSPPPSTRHRRRRLRSHRAFGGRQDFRPPVRTKPGRSHRRSVRNTLGRPPVAILGTRSGLPPRSPTHPRILGEGAPAS